MLEIILREIIAGTRPTPYHMTNGARLDWDAGAQQLTVTRINRSPGEREIAIFKAYLKRIGYRASTSTPVEIAPGLNSWIGQRLQLVKIEQPAPAASQGSLF
jgi:hypothetical protein